MFSVSRATFNTFGSKSSDNSFWVIAPDSLFSEVFAFKIIPNNLQQNLKVRVFSPDFYWLIRCFWSLYHQVAITNKDVQVIIDHKVFLISHILSVMCLYTNFKFPFIGTRLVKIWSQFCSRSSGSYLCFGWFVIF